MFVDVPAKSIFATVAYFCCYGISGEVFDEASGEASLLFFCSVGEPFFAIWSKSGIIICYMEQKRDLENIKDTCRVEDPGDFSPRSPGGRSALSFHRPSEFGVYDGVSDAHLVIK